MSLWFANRKHKNHQKKGYSDNFKSSTKQRVIALFLCSIITVSLGLNSWAVIAAAAPKSNSLPGALGVQATKQSVATDAQSSSAVSKNAQGLQATTTTSKVAKREEVTSKRTANTETFDLGNGKMEVRQFMGRINYKDTAGSWQRIDTTMVEDANAADSTNILGKAIGWVEGKTKQLNTYKVKANDWQARFAPSDDKVGMARIQADGKNISFSPIGANKHIIPQVSKNDGIETIRYADLWNGVDVVYTVKNDKVKEEIIIKKSSAPEKYAFNIKGATLHKNKDGGFDIEGVKQDFAELSLTLQSKGPIDTKNLLSQSYENGTLTVSLAKGWLKTQSSESFPIVIDPTWGRTGNVSWNYVAYKSDGYVCSSSVCYMNAGTSLDNYKKWRTLFYVDFNVLRGKVLDGAVMHLQQANRSYLVGYNSNRYYWVAHAAAANYNGIDGGAPQTVGLINYSGDINMKDLLNFEIQRNDWTANWMLWGEEWNGYTWKGFDPDLSFMAYNYSTTPATPTIVTPQPDQTFTDPQVSFQVNPVGDVDNDPVQYYFRISTGSDGETGTVINSGDLTSTQWTVPDGVLQDGTTYYVKAFSRDPYAYSAGSTPVKFKIDMRRGNDKTQSADSIGPVNVDLATGNVSTSIASHDTTALGGSLGVSLSYNSPARSRAGLVGRYWSNYTRTGAETMTRVDKNINFNWDRASYSAGQVVDNYSAEWTGYFVAPVTGSYQFGGSNDDGMAVYLGAAEQQVYNQGCYSGICYGSAYNMKQGDLVKIKIQYSEATGAAYAKLYVRGPIAEQVVPSDWLQTGVRSVAQTNGLKGSYYALPANGATPNLDASDKSIFLSRVEPVMNFNWGTGSPIANGPVDFMSRWDGYLTVPKDGDYEFSTLADDGTKINIDGVEIQNSWGSCCSEKTASVRHLVAGTQYYIKIDHYDGGGPGSFALSVRTTDNSIPKQIVPSSWLSPTKQVLPAGWNLGIDPDGDINYERLNATTSSVTLLDSSGDTHMYTLTNTGGYLPPVNEDGQLTRNGDGTFTLIDTDGKTYNFSASGELGKVTMPTDDRKPAALQYTYDGGRISKIADGIDSNRYAEVLYSTGSVSTNPDVCKNKPDASFDDAAPLGMICAVRTNDGRVTNFYYAAKLLARVSLPGNESTDYKYDSLGRIIGVRSSTANDAIAATAVTGRVADDTALTKIAYDDIGRAISVTSPAPTVGAKQEQQTIEYIPYATPFVRYIKTSGTVDRWVTTGSAATNYTPEPHISASLLLQQLPGTHPVYSCLVGGWDQMVSLDANCEGQQKIGLLGYAYDSPQPNGLTVPVRRCVIGGDHFVSHSDNCEGFTVESILGYAIAGNGMLGQTKEHIVDDPEPNGYKRKIEYDATFRTTRDTDASGKETYQQWDGIKDLLLSTTDATGLKSTTIYNANDMPTDSYGPAPSAWFDSSTRLPLAANASQVPHTSTGYDEGIYGPAVTYFAAKQINTSTLYAGQSLTAGQSLRSPDGRFTFVYQTDGNLVLYAPWGSTWNSGTYGKTSTVLTMQTDGNLVLYNGYQAVWSSNSAVRANPYLTIQNDGNAVVYTSSGVGWQAGTGGQATVAYNSVNISGAPLAHATNLVAQSAQVSRSIGSGSPATNVPATNWGMQMTGKLKLPVATNWTIRIWSDNGVKLWIDDELVINDWIDGGQRNHPTYTYNNVTANSYHRFKLDYYHTTGDANIGIYMTQQGQAETAQVAQYILPDYGLQTSQTVYGSATSNGATATVTSTTNYGSSPELGLASSATTDSTGLALTATSTYEAQGATNSYLRQTSSTLPGGATTTYAYYGATETRDNQCTPEVEAYRQGGMLRLKTEPDPDGTGLQTGRTTETIYDDTGKVVATRYNSDPWTCTTYDARERVTQTTVPAYNGQAARTVTNLYAVNDNPLITSSTDNDGTILVETDLLGRNLRYVDAKGNTTTSEYDNSGHLVKRTSPLGVETFTYDDYDRLVSQKLDDVTLATSTYDTYSRLQSVQYQTGLKLDLTRESTTTGLGRLTKRTYTTSTGQTLSDEVVRAVTGDVISGTELGQAKSYSYDTAGRLTAATVAGNTFTYGYGAQDSSCSSLPGANVNAGKDSNRTSQTVNGVNTTYCYDQADRLIASSNALYDAPVYDTHGNTTSLGSGTTKTTFTYDSSDRNIGIVETNGTATVTTTYTRDVQGRLKYRHHDTNGTQASDDYYGYTASGDSPDFITNLDGVVTEKYFTLPGDVLLTVRPSRTSAGSQTLSLPDIHGDIMATIDADGAVLGVSQTGPFGEVLAASTVNTATPWNTLSGASFQYVGQHEKLSETAYAVAPIQMGARVYIPGLGRFLSVDPVQGGTLNNYVYATDAVNDYDLTGEFIPLLAIAIYVGFLAWAAYDYHKDPSPTNMVFLALAVVPGGGGVGKTAKVTSKVVQGLERSGNAIKTVERTSKAVKVTKAADAAVAKNLGYKPVKANFYTHSQAAFQKGTKIISRDVGIKGGGSHSGGYWKMFDKSGKRLGTYDKYLKRRIGR